jgi:hypothetical protein
MNVQDPTMKTENAHVDHLLRAYFQAETPRTWMPPAVAASAGRNSPARKSALNGRMALAASLALLLGGLFLVSRNTHFESTTGPGRPAIDVASPAHKKPRTTSPAVGSELPKPVKPESN